MPSFYFIFFFYSLAGADCLVMDNTDFDFFLWRNMSFLVMSNGMTENAIRRAEARSRGESGVVRKTSPPKYTIRSWTQHVAVIITMKAGLRLR